MPPADPDTWETRKDFGEPEDTDLIVPLLREKRAFPEPAGTRSSHACARRGKRKPSRKDTSGIWARPYEYRSLYGIQPLHRAIPALLERSLSPEQNCIPEAGASRPSKALAAEGQHL